MTMPNQVELVGAVLEHLRRSGVKGLNTRQLNAVIAAADQVVAAVRAAHAPAAAGMGLRAWLACDDTGASALYMAHVLAPLAGLGQPPRPRADEPWPHDPADLGRCVGLLDAVPELRPHLPALAAGHGPRWAALAAAWDELEAPSRTCPRLYARMRAPPDAPAPSP